MPEPVHRVASNSSRDGNFPSTCWSQLLVAHDPARRREALATLARDYRPAVAAYLRAARALDAHAGDDLAQEFFAHVVESDWLLRADPRRGGFRAFLKQSLRNFANDSLRKERAEKRGAGRVVSRVQGESGAIDVADPDAVDPEVELDRRFRRTLVERALDDVKRELEAKGRSRQFEAFSAYFLNDDGIDYRAIGERLGLSPAEVSNALQRTKASFRERLRARVLETVSGEDELEGELAWLFPKDRS